MFMIYYCGIRFWDFFIFVALFQIPFSVLYFIFIWDILPFLSSYYWLINRKAPFIKSNTLFARLLIWKIVYTVDHNLSKTNFLKAVILAKVRTMFLWIFTKRISTLLAGNLGTLLTDRTHFSLWLFWTWIEISFWMKLLFAYWKTLTTL